MTLQVSAKLMLGGNTLTKRLYRQDFFQLIGGYTEHDR
jgi:hypothetical protein